MGHFSASPDLTPQTIDRHKGYFGTSETCSGSAWAGAQSFRMPGFCCLGGNGVCIPECGWEPLSEIPPEFCSYLSYTAALRYCLAICH